MSRINQKAFNILATEIAAAAAKDGVAGEVAQDIALKRLKRLRSQTGKPLTETELKELFGDILPNFNFLSKEVSRFIEEMNWDAGLTFLTPKLYIESVSGIV